MADEKAELFDCATCTRPDTHCAVCPIDEQPRLLDEASWYLQLRARMQRYRALPEAGGILDQDEQTMRILDLVDDSVGRYQDWKRTLDGSGEHGGSR